MAVSNACQENEAMQALMDLASLCTVPMAARAAILLNIPKILSDAGGPLTAKQIADRIPGTATSEAKLDRLLRALATYKLFDVTGSNPRAYGLNAVSNLLLKDCNELGVSLDCIILLSTGTSHLETMQHLHETILDDAVVPFEKLHGQPAFQYFAQNSSVGELSLSTISNVGAAMMKLVLKSYDGFKDVKLLVDVGGGQGTDCSLIMAAHPHISAINFDMPFVVAKAPQIPGVEHRGGSMFESVPAGGDAILLKTVLHNWDDKTCRRILGNCFAALPSSGKLVIIENLVPEEIEASLPSKLAVNADLGMMCIFGGGKERTALEYKKLVEDAGFKEFKVVKVGMGSTVVVEAHKL
uniref:TSA: Wollemia nobilis Ref_Wollemi_Transcript_13550_1176 transcribed RNA sequence n=1 Tax=Wollemia nobilis TaxID=56998 RepID=A0A0C9RKL3_9CONI